MIRDKKFLYILLGLLGFIIAVFYSSFFKSFFSKPPVNVSVKTDSTKLKPLAVGETIIHGKSYREGKLNILTVNYTNTSKSAISDLKIILSTNGINSYLRAYQWAAPVQAVTNGVTAPIVIDPKRDLILEPSKQIVFVPWPNATIAAGSSHTASFYLYTRERGTATIQAVVRTSEGQPIQTEKITITSQ